MAGMAAVNAMAVKSNMPKRGTPRSVAIETTNRLVDVPMVVVMPPIRTAKFIGISVLEGADPVWSATLTSRGNSRMTTGVSLSTLLSAMPMTSTASSATAGLQRQSFPRVLATGSRAPVATRA